MEESEQKSILKEYLSILSRPVLLAIVLVAGFMVQGYFMYQTATSSRSHNLVIVQKAPYRMIARWDSFKGEGNDVEIIRANIDERIFFYQLAKDIPYQDYKFNENLYIRINTVDLKTKEAKVNLNESSAISNKTDQTDIEAE